MARLVVTNREGRTVEVDAQTGISVMENIRELDASVEAICGGLCACATCHVFVDEAWITRLPPRGIQEEELLADLDAYDHQRSRLSCQVGMTEELDGFTLTVGPEQF